MKTALFFGSFNPIHVGHLIIAQHVIEHSNNEECWFVVSPHNPHKDKHTLLADYHRLAIARIAIEDNDKLKASDIEFHLEQPSYTIDSLTYLKEKFPEREFTILMGEDNLRTLHKWKNFEQILSNFEVIVYPRIQESGEKTENALVDHKSITMLTDVPQLKISASHIRKKIKAGKSVKYLLTSEVEKYVEEMHFYKF